MTIKPFITYHPIAPCHHHHYHHYHHYSITSPHHHITAIVTTTISIATPPPSSCCLPACPPRDLNRKRIESPSSGLQSTVTSQSLYLTHSSKCCCVTTTTTTTTTTSSSSSWSLFTLHPSPSASSVLIPRGLNCPMLCSLRIIKGQQGAKTGRRPLFLPPATATFTPPQGVIERPPAHLCLLLVRTHSAGQGSRAPGHRRACSDWARRVTSISGRRPFTALWAFLRQRRAGPPAKHGSPRHQPMHAALSVTLGGQGGDGGQWRCQRDSPALGRSGVCAVSAHVPGKHVLPCTSRESCESEASWGRIGSAGPPICGGGEEEQRGSLATAPAAAPQSMTLKHPPASCAQHPRGAVLTLTPHPYIHSGRSTPKIPRGARKKE
ncbi:hypothetical protein E2C01_006668 [Portunus trituberculatus]|uniref:Uncharacterized protein n=1 Tax=Portunus trituberculatus TaxID=210409 RepID=A0A5B7CWX3_PORTR|nr:hypothetical protein [Portunus trituberculatus]